MVDGAVAFRELVESVETRAETAVAEAERLAGIARDNGVSGGWSALYKANASIIEDPSLIYVGQELVLPTR